MRHVRHLALKIGARLAGSPQEQRAADYVEGQMRRLGLQNIRQQPFTCKWYDVYHASLDVKIGREWQGVTMDAVAHTPSTNGVLEAELVYVETATDDILARTDLKGKIALVHGTYGPSARMIKHLRQKQIAAVIWTDMRYWTDWNILVGLPYTFLPLFDFPAASVPTKVAQDLLRSGVRRVRLSLDTVVRDRPSQNVIGELPGKSDEGGVVICGHHDSVKGCTGAEDNAAGVGCMLAAAEALRGTKLEKPIRFVSFGTEEQLSQGAFAFVDDPTNRADALDFVLNVDGMGGWTGVNQVWLTGSPSLHEYMRQQMAAHHWPGVIIEQPDGFSDHFPFTVKDVPAAWLQRPNCAGGRWFHHSEHETIDVLSPQVLAGCTSLITDIALDIATCKDLPFERKLPAKTKRAIQRVARDWFDIS